MKDTYAFLHGEEMGEVVEPHCPAPTDIWRKIANGERKGYLKRERFRTLLEIYGDLNHHLDVNFCPKCGWECPRNPGVYAVKCAKCGEDCTCYIDEYFSLTGVDAHQKKPCGPYSRICCWAVTGGSEGHYVHIGCLKQEALCRREGHAAETLHLQEFSVYEDWFLIKAFRGMDHAYHQAARVAKLLGV
jgi:hypothetical protein